MNTRIGILGAAGYLPPEIRRNDYWPREVVDAWMASRAAAPAGPQPATHGERLVFEALRIQGRDPFQGTVERRVLAPELSPLDMEAEAAESAIERAGVARADIDLVLSHTVVPDYLLGNPACDVHHRLGLAPRCFSMHVDAAAYSFIMQLAIAEAMIKTGQARVALLVQSSVSSRVVAIDTPGAPILGDGASAVVVGPVAPDRGVLASVHYTDGSSPRTLIASVPGKRWYDDGRAVIHVDDAVQMQRVFLQIADVCKTSIDAVLAKAGVHHRDVKFLATHQGMPWLRDVVARHAGLADASSIDLFSRTGYIASAFVPMSLVEAGAAGILADGDLVVITGGGTGMTYGAVALRWSA
ncbi:MAG TPA: 3-oxoacyl-[acyl-carrier-protein] synthase III C-terminal domain-containing protein [Kofleriaceae bacterium]|nr:3-oxoacyl-[acyl-carrier-protein] synthase III C-terminal domain-containing protein [Kofleriaceae bacterium]